MMRRICLAIISCFFLVSCVSGTKSNKVVSTPVNAPQYTIKNPTFTSLDGKDVVFTGPAPDGQTAKIIVPSGQGFSSATLLSADTDEDLKININKWINKLLETDGTRYVDPALLVSPVFDAMGNFTMTESDLKMVNNRLETNGMKIIVSSSDKGLEALHQMRK